MIWKDCRDRKRVSPLCCVFSIWSQVALFVSGGSRVVVGRLVCVFSAQVWRSCLLLLLLFLLLLGLVGPFLSVQLKAGDDLDR